jgi:hypothetical protein
VDIVEEITNDHWRIRELLGELRAERRGWAREKRLFSQLKFFIERHDDAEERTLSSMSRRHHEIASEMLFHAETHSLLLELGARLARARSPDLWRARFRLYGDLLELHLDEEEEIYLRRLRESLRAEESRRLAAAYQSATAALLPLRGAPTRRWAWLPRRSAEPETDLLFL